jgi:hypothetical protein
MHEKRIAIYARTTPNEASLSAQIDLRKEWAEKREYPIDDQRIYREDGSASVHPREQEHLSRLLEAVQRHECNLVLVTRLDRFFRDNDGDMGAIEALKQFGMEVIVIDQPGETNHEHDVANNHHSIQLPEIDRSRDAAVCLRQSVKHMMAARWEKPEYGGYDGRPFPPGLVLERDAPKATREPVVYEPWQKAMLWIFDRGEELGYNANAVMREIALMPYLFPEIPEEDRVRYEFKTSLTRCPNGGYKPRNAGTVRSWWRNIMLAGGWPTRDESSNRVLMLLTNHPAVVDIPRFKRAYKFCTRLTLKEKK